MATRDVKKESTAAGAAVEPGAAERVLDNVVRLEEMLDESARSAVGALPVLEISKHIRIQPEAETPADPRRD